MTYFLTIWKGDPRCKINECHIHPWSKVYTLIKIDNTRLTINVDTISNFLTENYTFCLLFNTLTTSFEEIKILGTVSSDGDLIPGERDSRMPYKPPIQHLKHIRSQARKLAPLPWSRSGVRSSKHHCIPNFHLVTPLPKGINWKELISASTWTFQT